MEPVLLGDREAPSRRSIDRAPSRSSLDGSGKQTRAKSRQRSPTGTTPTETSEPAGLLSVKKSRRRNKHTSDSVHGSVNLSLDDLEDLPLIPPLVCYSPWRYILWSLFLFAICIAADAFTALGIPMEDMTGGDLFITAGWFAEFVAVVLILIGMLLLYFQKHPYTKSILVCYFISLFCFATNSLLHSSRINTFEFGIFRDYRNIGMQLKWLGVIGFYILFCILTYKAPQERVEKPSEEEVLKYDAFSDIRKLQNENRRLARMTLEEMKRQRTQPAEAKPSRPSTAAYDSEQEDDLNQQVHLTAALQEAKDENGRRSGSRSRSRSPSRSRSVTPEKIIDQTTLGLSSQRAAQLNIGDTVEDGPRTHIYGSVRRKNL